MDNYTFYLFQKFYDTHKIYHFEIHKQKLV